MHSNLPLEPTHSESATMFLIESVESLHFSLGQAEVENLKTQHSLTINY